MTGGYFGKYSCWIVMVAVCAITGVAEAAVTYPNLLFISRHKAWKNVASTSPLALQGTVELEYRTDEKNGCLWSLTNENRDAEYMIALRNGAIVASLWFRGCGYVFNQAVTPVTSVNGWHHVRLSWRQGSNTVFAVDGCVRIAANSAPLKKFTTNATYHQLGDNNYQFHRPFPFFGKMRNVTIRDTYKIVDSSMLAILAVPLFGLLAYAWRKHRQHAGGSSNSNS